MRAAALVQPSHVLASGPGFRWLTYHSDDGIECAACYIDTDGMHGLLRRDLRGWWVADFHGNRKQVSPAFVDTLRGTNPDNAPLIAEQSPLSEDHQYGAIPDWAWPTSVADSGCGPQTGSLKDPDPHSPDEWTPEPVDVNIDTAKELVEPLLRERFEAVATAPQARRNTTLYAAAVELGGLVKQKLVDRSTVETTLTDAARKARLDDREITATIRSGLERAAK